MLTATAPLLPLPALCRLVRLQFAGGAAANGNTYFPHVTFDVIVL